jgi:acyl-coenzyme A synthetase/AMP-(fatty) acid ligase
MQAYPDKRFYNVYGPTEATGISLYHCINGVPEDYQEKIPIGRPCRGTTVLLLNEDNTPTKKGDVGELCIGGPGLSPGYLNDRSKTEQAFIRNPENPERIYRSGDLVRLRNDGHYEFVSRKDGQVKFMGYRIELSEIEHALISAKEVRDAVVLLLESEHRGLNELVAFYEPENGAASLDIISHLKQRLPHYMMPKKLVPMERIPRCDRGKVSREALRSYYANLNQGQSC